MNNILKLLLVIYGISLFSPILAIIISLSCCGLMYRFYGLSKPVLIGTRLDSKSLQLESFLRMRGVHYYRLQSLNIIDYLAVLFGGLMTRRDIFERATIVNYSRDEMNLKVEPQLQGVVDDLIESMMDDYVPILVDMDLNEMANEFLRENGEMLPVSFQTQMALIYKFHCRKRNLAEEDVHKLLDGKSRKQVLKELFQVLDTFFSKKSLLFDNWTRGSASIFGRILLIRKYSKNCRVELKTKYENLCLWVFAIESSLHGDSFPFPYCRTKVNLEIHQRSMKPLLRFANSYFVPFMLTDYEKYKTLIDRYNSIVNQL